ncbi:MAG: PorV/PorQ family protein [Calditrichaceae bacterium]
MKYKMKINGTLVLVFFLLLAMLPLYAGSDARVGTAAGVQVLVPVGARDLAMGGANIVNTQGVDAIYWNPAGLATLDGKAQGAFSNMTIFSDIGVNYLALGVNMGSLGNLGFDIKSFDFGDIPETTVLDMDGASGKTYSPTYSTVGLTYANKLTETIRVGFTGKMIYESIPRAEATSFAFDIGIQYMNLAGLDGVSFAVVAKNIGQNMSYEGSGFLYAVQDPVTDRTDYVTRETSSDQLPASLEFGVAYTYKLMERNTLLISGDFANNNIDNDELKLGVEYSYNNFVALRGGYINKINVAAEDEDFDFSFGAGINYKLGNTMLSLDYAFRNSEYFDANNMFTLKVGF